MARRVFEPVSHTADLEIQVCAESKEGLFANCVIGMFQVMVPSLVTCTQQEGEKIILAHPPRIRTVDVRASNLDSLLVDFLSEALYLADVYDEVCVGVQIHELTDMVIRATLQNILLHTIAAVVDAHMIEIKAVTYHNLHIEQIDGLWQTNIVFDI